MTVDLPNPFDFQNICDNQPDPSQIEALAVMPGSIEPAAKAKNFRGRANAAETCGGVESRHAGKGPLKLDAPERPMTGEGIPRPVGVAPDPQGIFQSRVGDATPRGRSASASNISSASALAEALLDEIEGHFRFKLDEERFLEDIEEKPLFLRSGHA